jgi:molybdopterin/thiamine biosynthesis adenylyltransferase
MVELTDKQLKRYARQLILPEVDLEGQQRLLGSGVLIVGTGGLGGPVAQYLSGAGVGQLRLADDDQVDFSNLPRQVAFDESDVGHSKVEVLAERLARANSDIAIDVRAEKFDAHTASAMLTGIDLVIDATDSLQARLDIDRATRAAGLPWIMGSAVRMAGQWVVFDAERQFGCYHCLITEPAAADSAGCDHLGILGPVAGLVAMHQSVMAIKLLLGLPVPWGELHIADPWSGQHVEMPITKRTDCPMCQPVP